ncbi:porin [Neisseria perflava]|uniref:porin n=1 Tax=Neisseria perflava TaxID=33053 RepID=UPI0020A05FBC|nr:porin [Neisseria perflava]MCP1659146.1 putative porin [Neisseria perflava]MCP1771357.1 putative porin [Neisseria perflava]
MKFSLVPVCLLLAAPAFADTQIYGTLKSGIEASQYKYGGKTVSDSGVSDFGSYVGIRGSYPIGGSNNVIWQLEQDTPVGNDNNRSRIRWQRDGGSGESYIGVGQ